MSIDIIIFSRPGKEIIQVCIEKELQKAKEVKMIRSGWKKPDQSTWEIFVRKKSWICNESC